MPLINNNLDDRRDFRLQLSDFRLPESEAVEGGFVSRPVGRGSLAAWGVSRRGVETQCFAERAQPQARIEASTPHKSTFLSPSRLLGSRLFRPIALATTIVTTNAAAPQLAAAFVNLEPGRDLPANLRLMLSPNHSQSGSQDSRLKTQDFPGSEILTLSGMKLEKGKDGPNIYMSGQQKWDPMYKNVDMATGNYMFSVTDLDFQGGYGIPVSVQRTYSANNGDEGPFGIGWTLSADVRTAAGGLLKKGSAPVMATPLVGHMRHPNESDPRFNRQPSEGTQSDDSSANNETVQKDVDGILTTPAWDNNSYGNVTYETIAMNGQYYQVMTGEQVTTPEGTVYQYGKYGSYPSGVLPTGQTTGTPYPSNVVKVTSVSDRQGNITQYTYTAPNDPNNPYASFVKVNGTTSEARLLSVQMPNGHQITFNWTKINNVKWRITSVTDGTRTVVYGYDANYQLNQVTDPAGYVTYYTNGSYYQSGNIDWSNGSPALTHLIKFITDPRGLQTEIRYSSDTRGILPYGVDLTGVLTSEIVAPNGCCTTFKYGDTGQKLWYPTTLPYTNLGPKSAAYEWAGQPIGPDYNLGQQAEIIFSGGSSGGTYAMTTAAVGGACYNAATGGSDDTGNSGDPLNGVYDGTVDDMNTDARTFDGVTSNMLEEDTFSLRHNYSGIWINEGLYGGGGILRPTTATTTTYNFLGKPLSVNVDQHMAWRSANAWVVDPNYPQYDQYKEYAYWGASKYWQQKACVDHLPSSSSTARGRVSYTDYFDNTASGGSKGQTQYTYQDGFSLFDNTRDVDASNWRNDIKPHTATGYTAPYSATFAYDSKGRVTDVYKISGPQAGPYTYVRTNTTYNADGAGGWGEPNTVTEDYGGIGRQTKTLTYDAFGRATVTQDAAGHKFTTVYNNDGQVQSVTRTDVSPAVPIATYVYGTSGLENGQVLSVTDGLSNVVDTFTYWHPTDTGYITGDLGQVKAVAETWPWDNGSQHGYSCSYWYTPYGDRDRTQYVTDFTPSGGITWQYADYWSFGIGGSRQFQTMRLLDSSGNPTPEEFHYHYEDGGAMDAAGFAMTPAAGFTPASGQPWYDQTHSPSTRARAWFDTDGGAGRTLNLYYYWDTFANGVYSAQNITGWNYAYDLMTMFKTTATFLDGSGTSWNQNHQETYGYDSNFGYLTSATYGDGLPNASPVWTYDAAGNRASDSTNPGTWTYDHLNRMSASPMGSYMNDVLGNRQTGPSSSLSWDCLDRMSSFTPNGAGTTNYTYRSDGMRVLKVLGQTSTSYAYDGQTGFEDVDNGTTVTDYALGARGIDRLQRVAGNTVYPIYDGHGNIVSDISRNGASFTVGDQRAFDAWGGIRNGAPTGDPKGRYCANLGHKQDDESGLTYMKARYYDPACGRFTSEDPSRNGANWTLYCGNNPVNFDDPDGRMQFTIGDFTFRLDITGDVNIADFHVYKKGVEIISVFANGAAKHKVANEWTKDLVETLVKAAKSGNPNARALLAKLKNLGGFGIPDDIFKRGGALGVAYTSVDAYAQQNPEDFLDTMRIVMTFGQDTNEGG